MPPDRPRLPGVLAGVRRRTGRNERAIDGVAVQLRRLGQYDEHRRAVAALARTCGAALDRLEADPDRSEHVIGTVARVQLQALEALRPDGAGGDSIDELLTALRDAAPA